MTAPGANLSRPFPVSRLAVAGVLVVAGALVLGHRTYEMAEMYLASFVLGALTPGHTYFAAAHQAVYFGLGTSHPLGLAMTPECTSAFLVVPLVLVSAVLIALRPRITGRVLISLGVATVALIIVNQLRILLLASLVGWLGTDRGYYWGHTMVGSLVSVIGGAIALVLFVRLATRDRNRDEAAGGERG